jgi:uncharacterized protein with von Willebrand factor type A (vWA) domain
VTARLQPGALDPGDGRGGQLPARVLHFARALRRAGLPIGPGRVLGAVEAAAEVGLARRDDFYWALHAALVGRAEEHALFDEAFRLVWREPEALPGALELLLSRSTLPPPERPEPSRRVAEALAEPRVEPAAPPPPREVEVDAVLAWSDREQLRAKDFEQLSAAEVREAERAIARLRLPVRELPVRRWRPDRHGGRVDPRATLRQAVRAGPDAIPLRWRSRATRPPAVVALCDVSGSMARYARMLLRFLHALTRSRPHVHSFTFGTRLTDVTRKLRHRDVDAALKAVGRAVPDWEGGTRIGPALREFNLRWSRRLLSQGAVVLLLTDGLDRADAGELAAEAARLRRSCRRLVWLNPLLRFDGFEPRAAGVRAILPNVDEHRPVHSLDSLAALAEALSAPYRPRRTAPATRPRGP